MNDWQNFTQAEDGISFIQLEQVIAGVLQELTFMFADPADEDDTVAPDEECIKAKISFKGPVSGDLGLVFPRSLCFELIANILGLEQEDISEPSDAEDALKELLNVVCGQFLTTTFGSGLLFDLSIPAVEMIDRKAWERQQAEPDTTVILVEDEPVLFDLSMSD